MRPPHSGPIQESVAADVRRLCSIGFLQSEPTHVGCYNCAFSRINPELTGAHLDTARGPRTVPVRSMSARWGGLQKVSAFVPGHALRTGTGSPRSVVSNSGKRIRCAPLTGRFLLA